MESEEIFDKIINEFTETYTPNYFYTERDIVWTIQKRLIEKIKERELQDKYRIFNEYPLLKVVKGEKGKGRSKSTDLVIKNKKENRIEIAIEFKYEPDHKRKDMPPDKLKQQVVFWKDVMKDLDKIKYLMEELNLKQGEKPPKIVYFIFIDEGKYRAECYREIKNITDERSILNGNGSIILVKEVNSKQE